MDIIDHLDWSTFLEKTTSLATCEQTKDSVKALTCFEYQSDALEHQQDILEAMYILGEGQRPHTTCLDFMPQWMGRLKKAAQLIPLELKDIRLTCIEVLALKEILTPLKNGPWKEKILEDLLDAEEPLSAIDALITSSGDIRSDASELLFNLTREKDKLNQQIQNTLEKLVSSHDLKSYLQDHFVTTREGRWVLPIRSGAQHFVDGVIQARSQSRQTVFIEPGAVQPLNSRMRQVQIEIEEEIERLLAEISEYLHKLYIPILRAQKKLEEVDIKFSLAQMCIQVGAQRFDFDETKITLNALYHPLLKWQGVDPVTNDIQLSQDGSYFLLLSGPNAGGKTVLLKSIGLAAQMARHGLPICASNSLIPFFKNLHVSIGDSQTVQGQLSTFAAHLLSLNTAAQLSGPQNLILVDEICGSTDPEEGSALARAFIDQYIQNRSFAVVTSHLGPLKTGWKDTPGLLSGSMAFDLKNSMPTFQFISGIPGESLALRTAQRVGVLPQILEMALKNLSPETKARLTRLDELEESRTELIQLRKDLQKEISRHREEQHKLDIERKKLQKEKDQILQKALDEARHKVDDEIKKAKVENIFRKHTTLQNVQNQLPEIVKAVSPQASSDPIDNADAFAQKYPVGSRIFLTQLNQDGIIQSIPNSKGEVQVLSQSLRLSVHWKDLRSPAKFKNPTYDIARKIMPASSIVNEDRVLDLRGKTIDEALNLIEVQIDLAIRSNEDRLKIIHGHGTEALKKAIRIYLSRSVHVKKWLAGNPDQSVGMGSGGDGVTWAELGDS